ncbi:hypothetical protein GCM10009682_01300 [Luedemannella flava]|uniref:WD40 repeat protein n=1 Tax=Luedemannella flava TaxID=349316 RepID=A0ABP4XK55_9ACTN
MHGTPVRCVTLMLDIWCAAQVAEVVRAEVPQWLSDVDAAGARLVVVVATSAADSEWPHAFPAAFARAADHLASGGYSQPELRLETLVRVMRADPRQPAAQTVTCHLAGAEEPAGFLPNPRYEPGLAGVDVRRQDELWRDRARWSADDSGRFAPAIESFVGRSRALTDLCHWLITSNHPCVVAGEPGSGKTAVLTVLAALSDPARRAAVPLDPLPDAAMPVTGRIPAVIDAAHRSAEDVFADIAAAVEIPAATVGDLVDALIAARRMVTILVDGVDEALDPAELTRYVLRPFADDPSAALRLLVGARAYLAPVLGPDVEVIDLDAAGYADPAGMDALVRTVLVEAYPDSPYRTAAEAVVTETARAIVEASGSSFLMAQVVAQTTAASVTPGVAPQWHKELPHTLRDAVYQDLQRRLGPDARRAADLLLPLVYVQGPGLPWEDLWPRLAIALASDARYSNEDLVWLRDAAGRYVTEGRSGDRSVYRLANRALAPCLDDGRDAGSDHAAIMQVVAEYVPRRDDGSPDWGRAHPYARHHLAGHAIPARRVDDLLTDVGFLLATPLPQVRAALDSAESAEGRAAADAYRRAMGRMRTTPPAEHAAYLELAARCGGPPALADALAGSGTSRPWSVPWANWRPPMPHRTLTGHAAGTMSVAVGRLDGRPIVVSGSDDHTVRVWDLATGKPVGEPLTGHTGGITAVATGILGNIPIAVTGSDDRTVRVWNLRTGTAIGNPLVGHTAGGLSLAVGGPAADPMIVSGGDDWTVRVWDARTGRALHDPLVGHTGGVTSMAIGALDGDPIAVSASRDGTVRVWNLLTGEPVQPVGNPFSGHRGAVAAVALSEIDGQPVVVSGGDDHTIRVWSVVTGAPVGTPMGGHTDGVTALASGELDGMPVVVSGSRDHTIRVWNLTTATGIGDPLVGHVGGVTSVALVQFSGHPVAVSASHDHTVRVWDSVERHIGRPFTGHTDSVMSVACGTLKGNPVAVSGSADYSLRIWDLITGYPVGRRLTGHQGGIWTVAWGRLRGRPIAVSGSADHRIRVWDLETQRPIGEPFTGHTGWIWSVALGELSGRPIVVSGADDHSVRVWDLATGIPARDPLVGHTSGVTAVAFGEFGGRPIALSGSHDATVQVWNLTTGRPIVDPLTGHTGAVWAVALGVLDGQPVVISGGADRTVRIWDLRTGSPIGGPLAGHTEAVYSLAVTELAGQPVAVSGSDDESVRIWDLSQRLVGKPLRGHTAGVRTVAVTHVAERPVCVSGSHDRTLRVWDLTTRTAISRAAVGGAHDVRAVAIGRLHDSPILVSGGADDAVRIFDLATGAPVGRPIVGHTNVVEAVAVAQVGDRPMLLSAGQDHTVRTWDPASGSPLSPPRREHSDDVVALAVGLADNRAVAVSSSRDHTLRVWDLVTGAAMGAALTGHTSGVQAVAIGQLDDIPIAVSGGDDHTVRVWDLRTGQPLCDPLTGHIVDVTAVAIGEVDGHPVAMSAGSDGSLLLWQLDAGHRRGWRLRRGREPAVIRDMHVDHRVDALALHLTDRSFVVAGGTAVERRSLDDDDDVRRIDVLGDVRAVAASENLVGVGTTRGLLVLDLAPGPAPPRAEG